MYLYDKIHSRLEQTRLKLGCIYTTKYTLLYLYDKTSQPYSVQLASEADQATSRCCWHLHHELVEQKKKASIFSEVTAITSVSINFLYRKRIEEGGGGSLPYLVPWSRWV